MFAIVCCKINQNYTAQGMKYSLFFTVIELLHYFYAMQLKNARFLLLLPLFAAIVCTFSCRKQKVLTTGGVLKFSTDTLKFDTVFTAAGSFTTGLLIYNTQDEPVIVSSVRLKNGASSYFHLNVDGFSGNNVSNLHIAAHDSLYVFATVNIDPTIDTTPFIIYDQLIATLNGKDFGVEFTAFGQNAHYIINDSFGGNTTWDTHLPYVVVHKCVIGPGATLNIPPKCRVYMHQDARFFVFGTLKSGVGSMGQSDTVVFQGDRLDRAYFGYIGYPGEWGGIYVAAGGTCSLTNSILKNCGGSTYYYNFLTQSAAVEVDSGGYLVMDKSIITNSFGHGILGFEGNVTATNCLVNYCGGEALAVILGGKDSFTNCTFANYSTAALSHINNPTVGIVNWLQIGDNLYAHANLNAVLRNCIVWGSLDSELVCDTSGTPAGMSTYMLFDHCVLDKGSQTEPFVQLNACTTHDPRFKDPVNFNFHLDGGDSSSAAGNGTPALMPSTDLGWQIRTTNDIGCYQH